VARSRISASEPGEGESSAPAPSPALTPLGHPLPQGERGKANPFSRRVFRARVLPTSSLRGAEATKQSSIPSFHNWIASLSLAMTRTKRRSKSERVVKAVSSTKRPLSTRFRQKEGAERRQTHCLMPARKRRAGRATEKGGLRRPPLAGALACRRSTAVLAKGTFVPRAQHRARLPEDGAKAAAGRTRHFRSQRCTSRAGHNAGRHDAGAARARSVPFRPRAAHSLRRQGVPQRRPLRARLGGLIVFAAGKSNGLKPPNKRGCSPDACFLKVRSTRMILWRCGEVVRIAALFAPTTNLAAAEAS